MFIGYIQFVLGRSFCFVNPCRNGGTCREGDERFICDCPKGFSGPACAGMSVRFIIQNPLLPAPTNKLRNDNSHIHLNSSFKRCWESHPRKICNLSYV